MHGCQQCTVWKEASLVQLTVQSLQSTELYIEFDLLNVSVQLFTIALVLPAVAFTAAGLDLHVCFDLTMTAAASDFSCCTQCLNVAKLCL